MFVMWFFDSLIGSLYALPAWGPDCFAWGINQDSWYVMCGFFVWFVCLLYVLRLVIFCVFVYKSRKAVCCCLCVFLYLVTGSRRLGFIG